MKSSGDKSRLAKHGGGVRGADNQLRSPLFEGRFGRLFRELPAAVHTPAALRNLGIAMLSTIEQKDGKPSAAPETADRLQDDEENSGISAGYTYFGQFIDHDITFDPASSLMQQNDVEALVDYRTPRLDLDSLYGRGPADQPYMYVGDKFRLGARLTEDERQSPARDLPRFEDTNTPDAGPARALIGEKRNDENVIIAQLHSAFLQFHNRLVDDFGGPKGKTFEQIQQMVRWHYQYVVVNDFLVKICGADVVDAILPNRLNRQAGRDENAPNLQIFKWRNDAFIPLEFTVAAYRFGHSMVRPIYRLNTLLNGGDNPHEATKDERDRGLDGRFFIFAGVHQRALNGFGPFPKQWAIDWSLFFDINGSGERGWRSRLQPAYKIDTSLVNPLGFLPEFSRIGEFQPPLSIEQMQPKAVDGDRDPANLAVRNLLRGAAMNMPSGQAVARFMGMTPLTDDELRVGKAIVNEWKDAIRLSEIDASFKDNAPLWYYVLAEAQHHWFLKAEKGRGNEEPQTLGPVGGRIVAETLIGLIWNDAQSYLNQAPNWIPEKKVGGEGLTVGKLLAYALDCRRTPDPPYRTMTNRERRS